MKILFVVPPLTGHINPTLGLAHALSSRGHEVAWAGHASVLRSRLPAEATILGLPEELERETLGELIARAGAVKGLEIVKSRWEDVFIPLARAMYPHVLSAIDGFRPDLLVVDHQAIGGALAARRSGLPWATLATTSVPLLDPFGSFPKVREWVDGLLSALELWAGLLPMPNPDRSPTAVIVTSTPELAGPSSLGPEVHWVGPIVGPRPAAVPFPWEQLDRTGRKKVLVSLGTVNAEIGGPFYAAMRDALTEAPEVQGIIAGPLDVVGLMPSGTVVVPWVPQLELLGHVDAVVSHGGHNTVTEALLHGLPLVVAPIKDDQPMVASQVAASGAGIRVHNGRRANGAQIARALRSVLTEPHYAEAARRIQGAFQSAGGAERAADVVLGLERSREGT